MAIEVTHRGYAIHFNENSEEWYCQDLGNRNYSATKLSTIKAAIDRMLLDLRKKSSLPCFEIDRNTAEKSEATIIAYAGVDQRSWDMTKRHKVAIASRRKGSERLSRRETDLYLLMPDTAEAHDAFASFGAAHERLKIAEAEVGAAFKAIPRVTLEMIPELVSIASRGEIEAGS